MIVGVGTGLGFGRRSPVLLQARFTGLAAGSLATLPGGLAYSCASGSRTVQTGTSTVVSGVGIDAALVGRLLDAHALGLVLDPGRTNNEPRSNSSAGWAPAFTPVLGTAAGPDGAAASAIDIADDDPVNTEGITEAAGAAHNGVSETISVWYQNIAGGNATKFLVAGNDGLNLLITRASYAAWGRATLVGIANAAAPITNLYPAHAGFDPGATLGRGLIAYLQREWPAAYPSEAIPTAGAAVARAGARLYHPRDGAMVCGGRLALEVVLRPKGAATEYAADGAYVYLWYRDATNYARLDTATRRLEVVTAGGVAWSPVTALSWARGDTVRLWVEAGGGSLVSRAKYRVNAGAVTDLGASVAAQAAIPTGSTLDLLCAGVIGQLAAHIEEIVAWSPGCRPGWAS